MRISSDPGVLFVLAGPSGAGKTTLSHHLVGRFGDARFSVSTTTRPPRGEERDGVDYFFVDSSEFDRRISCGWFLEWAEVHGHRYGTSAGWVDETLASGTSVILDIDVQGAMSVRAGMPGAVLIFVMPPSMETLASRLSLRGTDCGDSVRRRLAASAGEIRYCGAFDYIVTNDDLGSSTAAVEAIYTAEKARTGNRAYPHEAAEYEAGALDDSGYWRGRRVVVTAGPTREPIDEVRFVSNRSSGLMGCEMAAAFRDLGAETVLLLGPGTADAPPGVRVVRFQTSRELQAELPGLLEGAGLLAMSAAVADYRPVSHAAGKTPRMPGGMVLELETVPDLVAGLSGMCPVLSFSLEYGDGAEARAMGKLREKGVSASFCNRGDLKGQGIESPVNSGILLFSSGERMEIPAGAKRFVAAAVAAAVGRWLAQAAAQR